TLRRVGVRPVGSGNWSTAPGPGRPPGIRTTACTHPPRGVARSSASQGLLGGVRRGDLPFAPGGDPTAAARLFSALLHARNHAFAARARGETGNAGPVLPARVGFRELLLATE